MKFFPLTLPSPEENLACDEALLEAVERDECDAVLRVWNALSYFVVVGYSNRVETEVNVPFCRSRGVPILRRCSGGGTVLQGPGCLNYSLILRIEGSAPLSGITRTNDHIMGRNRDALMTLLGPDLSVQGHTDLTRNGLKFSGNAQKRKLKALLFHGTFLLGLDLGMVERSLRMPSKEPGYRANRSHADFIMNLEVPASQVQDALVREWKAHEALGEVPTETISRLVREKYACSEWNWKF
jgi:lipoate---protein ligase